VGSWADLEKNTPRAEPDLDQAADLCARVFTTPDVRNLMKLLRERYIERALPFTVPEAALRSFEGQRQLVREIEALTERGLRNLSKKSS
jgi:hypothetical protein